MRVTQRGLSLVELMISLAVGLLVLLVLSDVLVNLLATQAQDRRRSQLSAMLDGAASLIAVDLRRAGYDAGGAARTPYGKVFISPDGSCLRYAYDTPPGMPASSKRYFAVRLNRAAEDGPRLERLQTTESGWRCDAPETDWQAMSSPGLGRITALRFGKQQGGIEIELAGEENSGEKPETVAIRTLVSLRNQPEASIQ
ncbi:prepilin-type N-terminal cleavage/methylation domain-containing protein [uncultured Aquitalea sp.]|uniref:prepilin-type N-terminal cleavage/methylation domain-containing protein n=1 Tax=uncultured Aquitalea sp. TaxID=540272 RepID=UPI0025CD2A1E|nr:prepilin-type N-terminal cleavage/methylation domain-containing protein [uncultured Aquitalea sp.]